MLEEHEIQLARKVTKRQVVKILKTIELGDQKIDFVEAMGIRLRWIEELPKARYVVWRNFTTCILTDGKGMLVGTAKRQPVGTIYDKVGKAQREGDLESPERGRTIAFSRAVLGEMIDV